MSLTKDPHDGMRGVELAVTREAVGTDGLRTLICKYLATKRETNSIDKSNYTPFHMYAFSASVVSVE